MIPAVSLQNTPQYEPVAYVGGPVPPVHPTKQTTLGSLTKISTPLPNISTELRAERLELRRVAARLLPDDRVATCGQFIVPEADTIDVIYQEGHGAHYNNIAVCGGAWVCPVCASAAAAEHQAELTEAINKVQAAGYFTPMLTFTLQHHPTDALTVLLDDLGDAMQRTIHGAPWRRFKEKHGILHHVYVLEPRVGGMGWLPHRHMMLVTSRDWDEAEAEEVQAWLTDRYGGFMAKRGRYLSKDHGIQVSTKASAKQYLTKWAQELTGSQGKRGASRSPFQLLADYRDGDKQAGAMFAEYAAAIKGKHQLQWSKGMRDWIDTLPEPEADPEAEEVEASEPVVMVRLSPVDWRVIWHAHAEGDLLRVASTGDRLAVMVFLRRLGIGLSSRLRNLEPVAVPFEDRGGLLAEAELALVRGDYVEC